MNPKIIKLSPKRWKEYKELRLESLEREPLAFGASYKEEASKPDSYWKDFLVRSNNPEGNSLILFAEVNGKLVGRGIVYFGIPEKFKHIARFSGIYVKKEYRGQGIAKALFSAKIDAAFAHPGIEKIKLVVNTTQKAAVKLYSSLGFQKVGLLRKEFKIDENCYNAYLMELLRENYKKA